MIDFMKIIKKSLRINNLCPLQNVTNSLLHPHQYLLYLHYKVNEESMEMQIKMIKQIRAIKKYARAIGIFNLDTAAIRWVETGCAEKWATQN